MSVDSNLLSRGWAPNVKKDETRRESVMERRIAQYCEGSKKWKEGRKKGRKAEKRAGYAPYRAPQKELL